MNEEKVIERIRQLYENSGCPSVTRWAKKTFVPQTTLNDILTKETVPNLKTLDKICFAEKVSADWVLYGDEANTAKGDTVRYHDYAVTGGQVIQFNELAKKDADGFINIPEAKGATDAFKVVGFSMSPTIEEGEVIGVKHVEHWEWFDPDRIYLITTTDGERMIKRILEFDEDTNRLKLGSDNPQFKPFTVPLAIVLDIYRVVFHMNIETL